jgi:putative acetyltransferase
MPSGRLKIREQVAGDGPAVWQVNRRAFGRDDEARLVERLQSGGWARVSLVAESDGRVAGHVLFSELAIVAPSGTTRALALAPLAVLPEYQSRGVGSTLVRRGLEICRGQGHAIVIVVGHPGYYPRFGFSAELARSFESPYAGESFMALELAAGALAGIAGRVEYPPPFGEL